MSRSLHPMAGIDVELSDMAHATHYGGNLTRDFYQGNIQRVRKCNGCNVNRCTINILLLFSRTRASDSRASSSCELLRTGTVLFDNLTLLGKIPTVS